MFVEAFEQQNRYIYIQAENQKSFYVKMDDSYLSSSASGYIIIPKLSDGIHKLKIGTAENDWPEQNVTISLKLSNAGFVLKNADNKNLSLVNLQTLQPVVLVTTVNMVVEEKAANNGDGFAGVLAQVVNDPSIALSKPVAKETQIVNVSQPEPLSPRPLETKEINIDIAKAQHITDKSPDAEIFKLKETTTAEGVRMAYADIAKTGTDTIEIFFPADEKIALNKTSDKKLNAADEAKAKSKTDSHFLDMQLQNPNVKQDSTLKQGGDLIITEKKTKPTEIAKTNPAANEKMINSDCKKFAMQKDFLNLRKQMVAAITEADMTRAAIKSFTSTCYTTEQIKNLGVLFTKEEGRYKFYVASYPFVSDTHNFAGLEDQLNDTYYQSRFKAMVSR